MPAASIIRSRGGTHLGPAAGTGAGPPGGGVEVKLNQDWSAKVEYLYVGLQDKSVLQSGAESGVSRTISASSWTTTRCGWA